MGFGYVLATESLITDHKRVGYMYRECSTADDSGWRFFAGDESRDYLNEPNNINVYSVKTILEIDSSILPYLNSPPYSSYRRDNKTGEFLFDTFSPGK